MEELLHPLLKVPFEKANKSFRLFHKHVSREIAAVQKAVFALQEEQPSAQHTLVQDTIESLELIAERIRNAQHDAKQFVAEQQKDINSCVLRAQYVHKYQAGSDTLAATAHAAARVPLGGTTASTWNLANVFTRTESQTMENDRLIADYLLSHGYIKSSKLIQETKGVEFVVDHDLHLQCHSIVNDLLSHNVSTAIAWCTENGSRLRRLQSQLEFQLRLQEFIELVRSDKKLEAIQYAQSNLTPISLQNEDEATRKTMMEAIQEAMATLAYKTPEQCGVEAYVQLFSKDRWQKLKDSFRTTFCMVYGIHSPPALCIALYAGISSLNTRTCRRYREETSSAKKRRRQDDDDDDDGEEEEHAVEVLLNASMLTEAERQEMGIQLGLQHKRHGEHEGAHHRSKKLKADQDSDASGSPPPPLCPTCSEVGGKLCGSLPFAHHPHSRLVCRVTQSVMDEHNPPMALPNGYVFSRRAIQQLTATEDSVDIVTCPVTEDRYQASQLKSVYIL